MRGKKITIGLRERPIWGSSFPTLGRDRSDRSTAGLSEAKQNPPHLYIYFGTNCIQERRERHQSATVKAPIRHSPLNVYVRLAALPLQFWALLPSGSSPPIALFLRSFPLEGTGGLCSGSKNSKDSSPFFNCHTVDMKSLHTPVQMAGFGEKKQTNKPYQIFLNVCAQRIKQSRQNLPNICEKMWYNPIKARFKLFLPSSRKVCLVKTTALFTKRKTNLRWSLVVAGFSFGVVNLKLELWPKTTWK